MTLLIHIVKYKPSFTYTVLSGIANSHVHYDSPYLTINSTDMQINYMKFNINPMFTLVLSLWSYKMDILVEDMLLFFAENLVLNPSKPYKSVFFNKGLTVRFMYIAFIHVTLYG